MSVTRKTTRNTKNNTCAMVAAPAAIPVKPKIAATIATRKNTSAQYNIQVSFLNPLIPCGVPEPNIHF